jgi:hypothetical protein
MNNFLRACPQTPRVGFAESWVSIAFCESRTTLFASFSGKRSLDRCKYNGYNEYYIAQYASNKNHNQLNIQRHPLLPVLLRIAKPIAFCEAELRFLLLFLKKEDL